MFPATLNEGDFSEEILVGMDVVLYTTTKASRPWVGRVVTISNTNTFKIQWYEKVPGKANKFKSVFLPSGEPYISEVDTASAILWDFTRDRTETSFTISTMMFSKISELYDYHDRCQ